MGCSSGAVTAFDRRVVLSFRAGAVLASASEVEAVVANFEDLVPFFFAVGRAGGWTISALGEGSLTAGSGGRARLLLITFNT